MMPSADDPRSFGAFQRLVQAWQEGSISQQEKDRLSEMLRGSRAARAEFLEAMQIDAELFWRYAAQPEADALLAVKDDGAARPIASVAENQLAFWGDLGFQQVFDELRDQERQAHLWLQLYPRIRASVFLCIPEFGIAENTVNEICGEICSQCRRGGMLRDLRRAVAELTRQRLEQRLRGVAGVDTRSYMRLVVVLLQEDVECDPLALYESIESFIPHHVPADVLLVLSLRYLLELRSEKIAETLELSVPVVFDKLAKARLFIWNLCVEQSERPIPRDVEACLSLVIEFFERPPASSQTIRELIDWLRASGRNRRRFVTFCMLHESLYRQLSLGVLFDELSKRTDDAFRSVVEVVVNEFETRSRLASPLSESRPRRRKPRSVVPLAWGAATAACLMLAFALGAWGSRKPVEEAAPPPVAANAPPSVAPAEPPLAPMPAPPPVVGVVSVALGVESQAPQSLGHGDPVRLHDEIALEKGFVQLLTTSGGVWVLQAPIRAVVEGESQILLRHGKIVGRNSGDGTALVVRSPTSTVVDLGTEFGVSVSDDASASIAVYEGAVELRALTGAEGHPPVSVKAGYQAEVASVADAPVAIGPLLHDRAFVRPDELQLRKEAIAGSAEAAEKVAFYELLRIEGLLAYQGFHSASDGSAYTIGFADPGARPQGAIAFGPKLAINETAFGLFDSMVTTEREAVYLDLDTDEKSRIGQAGLLGPDQKIGHCNGSVWVSWRSRCDVSADERLYWAGMSLMFGDERNTQEPLFIGEPADLPSLGIHTYIRKDSSESRIELDFDPYTPGIQSLPRDTQCHTWVANLRLRESGQARAEVWCDADLSTLRATPAHATYDFDSFHFDRFRFEVSSQNESATCAFDEIVVATTLESLAAVQNVLASEEGLAAVP